MGGHSSSPALARRVKRPTRAASRNKLLCRPYSVLHPVGFTVPPLLPATRCALAAPFRPYPSENGRNPFCGTIPHPPKRAAGRYPAPLFHGARTFLASLAEPAAARPSGEGRYSGRLKRLRVRPRVSGLGGKRTLGIASNELKNGHGAEAKQDCEKDHRRPKPKDLTVPAPSHVECLVYGGCNPHDGHQRDERHANYVYRFALTHDEAVQSHNPSISLAANVRNGSKSDASYCGLGSNSDSNFARHSPSMIPSIRSGLNRRWKAITAFCGSSTS